MEFLHRTFFTPFKKNSNEVLQLKTSNRLSRLWYLRRHYFKMLLKYFTRIGIKDTVLIQFPFLGQNSVSPITLSVEFTNNCNLKCIYCTSPQRIRKVGYMSRKTFDNLIKSISETNVKLIGICGNGEPTLHPECMNFVSELKKITPVLSLTSNGHFLHEDLILSLLKSNLDVINISVHSMNKSQFEYYRKKGDFDGLIRNLTLLREIKDKLRSKVYTNIRVMMTPDERELESEIVSFWKRYGDAVSRQYVAKITTKGLECSYDDWYSSDVSVKQFPKCTLPFKALDVHWNGDVPLCTYSEMQIGIPGGLKIGNINQKSLSTLWNEPLMSEYRKGHRDRIQELMPICKGCLGT